MKKKQVSKKTKKFAKIWIGSSTILGTGVAVLLPLLSTFNNKSSNSQDKDTLFSFSNAIYNQAFKEAMVEIELEWAEVSNKNRDIKKFKKLLLEKFSKYLKKTPGINLQNIKFENTIFTRDKISFHIDLDIFHSKLKHINEIFEISTKEINIYNKLFKSIIDKSIEKINNLKYPDQNNFDQLSDQLNQILNLKNKTIVGINHFNESQRSIKEIQKLVDDNSKRINDKIKKYKNDKITIEFENQKNKSIGFIESLQIPIEDNQEHNNSLFNAIKQAKTKALNDIEKAKTKDEIIYLASSPTQGAAIEAIINAIRAYNNSTGISQEEINQAQSKINNFDINKANLIFKGTKKDKVVTNLKTDDFKIDQLVDLTLVINKVTPKNNQNDNDIAKVTIEVSSNVKDTTSKEYTIEVSGFKTKAQKFAEELTQAKEDASKLVTDLAVPNQDDDLHDASLFGAIAIAKQAALDNIKKATTIAEITALASSPTTGSAIKKINTAIQAYNDSTGTNQVTVNNLQTAFNKLASTTALSSTITNEAITQIITDFNSTNNEAFTIDENTFKYNDWDGTITFELNVFNENKTFTISGFDNHGNIDNVPQEAYKDKVLPQGFFIPDTVNKININAFENATLPQGFKIPDSITRIEDHTFKNTTNVPNIPETVTFIGGGVFEGTTLPNNWKNPQAWSETIRTWAYQGATLPDGFVIPNTVTTIDDKAFIDAKNVPSFPTSVTQIGTDAIKNSVLSDNWTNPKAWSPTIPAWAYVDATLPDGFVIPKTVTEIQNYAFINATNVPNFPASVTQIGTDAIKNSVLSDNWTNPQVWSPTIPAWAYVDATLPDSFVIPKTVTKIADNSFSGVTFAQGSSVPKQIKIIKMAGNTKTKPTIKNTSQGKTADNTLSASDFELPIANGLSFEIISAVKSNTNTDGTTATVTIKVSSDDTSDGTTSREYTVEVSGFKTKAQKFAEELTQAKEDASKLVTDLAVPNQDDDLHDASLFGAIAIAKQAALDNIKKATTIAEITALASSPTTGSAIKKINTAIQAYNDSTGTNQVTVNNLQTAFNKLASTTALSSTITNEAITQIITDFNSTNNEAFTIDENTFKYNDWDGTITFELNVFNENKTFTISGFDNHGNIDNVPQEAYKDKVLPQGFFIPDTVNKININAFENATLPQGFKIPDSITRIEDHTFKNTTNVPNIPETVTFIGGGVFEGTTLPNNWKNPQAWSETIRTWAYQGATLPDGFVIPNTVTTIDDKAFIDAKNVPSFPTSVTQIGTDAIKNSVLSDNWTNPKAWSPTIPAWAYVDATLPDGFVIPKTVTEIQNYAFINAINVPNFPASVTQIGTDAIKNSVLSDNWTNPQVWSPTIPAWAYVDATLPDSFVIPKTVTKIADNSFSGVTFAQGSSVPKQIKIIKMAGNTKTKPTIKNTSQGKTADNTLSASDFELPIANGLSFEIISAVKSNTNTDGTTATVTIKVSSDDTSDGTTSREYTVEVSGFTSKADFDQAKTDGQTSVNNLNPTKNNALYDEALFDDIDTAKQTALNDISNVKNINDIDSYVQAVKDAIADYHNSTSTTADNLQTELSSLSSVTELGSTITNETIKQVVSDFNGDHSTSFTITENSFKYNDWDGTISFELNAFNENKTFTISGFQNHGNIDYVPNARDANGNYKGIYENKILPQGFFIPDTVNKININAFENATLPQGFKIPASITRIEDHAFIDATNVPTIPNTVTYIGGGVFERVNLPSNWTNPQAWNTTIRTWAYQNAILPDSFVIPNTVTTIGDKAFKGATNVPNIPTTVTSIAGGVFEGVSLPSDWINPQAWNAKIPAWSYVNAILPDGFTIPDTVNEIESNAFYRAINVPNIPSSVTSIGTGAFIYVTLPSNWTNPQAWSKTIPYKAYQNATLPDGFVIPDTVTTIDDNAFIGATFAQGSSVPKQIKIIKMSGTTKTKPTITNASQGKTAENSLSASDFELPIANGLSFEIISAVKSNTNTDGTTATVTIKVSSDDTSDGTTSREYTVEVSGFTSKADFDQAKTDGQTSVNNLNPTKNNALYDEALFDDIDTAKQTALNNISNVKNINDIDSYVQAVKDAIADYHNSNGTTADNLQTEFNQLVSTAALGSTITNEAIKQVVSDFNGDHSTSFTITENSFKYNDWDGTITFELNAFNENKTFNISGFDNHGNIDNVPQEAYKDKVLPQGFFIPDTVNKININAFENATLPQGFKIPASITRIEDHAFIDATNVPTIPNTVTYIGGGVFERVNLPSNWTNPQAWNTTIRTWAYQNAILPDSFVIPNTVTTIGDNAFINATNVPNFPASVTRIGTDAIKNSVLSDNWTNPKAWSPSIPAWAYVHTTLPDGFVIPDTVTTIENFAFYAASNVTNIPTTVTKIHDESFMNVTFAAGSSVPKQIEIIKMSGNTKIKPTIKNTSKEKTADNPLSASDFELPTANGLSFEIISAVKSSTTTDGTTATVTIKVSSDDTSDGTTSREYTVEVSGFTSKVHFYTHKTFNTLLDWYTKNKIK